MVILSSTYFGPVQWYQKLCRHGHVAIERYDHFMKQTYRNRCVIAAANGPQALTVPVEKGETQPLLMKDVRISDHGNWRHLHWQALRSAYEHSPFFEFYADEMAVFYEGRPTAYLLDFNMQLQETVCQMLGMDCPSLLTENYQAEGDFTDLRNGSADGLTREVPYYQVFSDRHGFMGGLSIADLLFNMGPESLLVLRDMGVEKN